MASKKDLSVGDKLKQLYELQLIDSEVDQITILKGELPIEVSDLEDELAGLDTRIQKLQANLKELDGEVSRQQLTIKESNALIERYQKQLDNVKNNREYDALMKELELQKLEIQLSEKRIRESSKNVESKQETLDAATKRFSQKQKDLDTKKVELDKIIEKTEKDEEKLRKKGEKFRKNIEDRLLKAYDKIRNSYRNGLAVVTVRRSACGGCFNQIPPQMQLEIGLHKKIVACEHCGRILVDESILESAEIIEGIQEQDYL